MDAEERARAAVDAWMTKPDPYGASRDTDLYAHVAAAIRAAEGAMRERCATAADLVAANYRESAVLYGEAEPGACYLPRANGAEAAARRIREGK